jgi:hypothetical protein
MRGNKTSCQRRTKSLQTLSEARTDAEQDAHVLAAFAEDLLVLLNALGQNVGLGLLAVADELHAVLGLQARMRFSKSRVAAGRRVKPVRRARTSRRR